MKVAYKNLKIMQLCEFYMKISVDLCDWWNSLDFITTI